MKDRKSSSLPTSVDLESHELLMTLIVESFGSFSKRGGGADSICIGAATDLSSTYYCDIQTFPIRR